MNEIILYEKIEKWVKEGDCDKTLDISNLELKKFPNFNSGKYTSLKNLKRLICKDNLINEIDTKELPINLEYFDCSYNKLTYIPELPQNLTTLICSSNLISGLPNLPKYLGTLICSYNNLKELDGVSSSILPDTLIYLDCSYNQIERIYQVPLSLKTLICKGNPIKETILMTDFYNDMDLYVSSNSEDDLDSQSYESSEVDEIIDIVNESKDIILDNGKNIIITNRNYILENAKLSSDSKDTNSIEFIIKDLNNLKLSSEKYKTIALNDSIYYEV